MAAPNFENPIEGTQEEDIKIDALDLEFRPSNIIDNEKPEVGPEVSGEKITGQEGVINIYEKLENSNGIHLRNELIMNYPNLYGPLFELSYKSLDAKLRAKIESKESSSEDISINVSFSAEGPLENNTGDNYKDFTFKVRCERPVDSFETFADEIQRKIAEKIDGETNNDGSLLRNIPKYHMTDAKLIINEEY